MRPAGFIGRWLTWLRLRRPADRPALSRPFDPTTLRSRQRSAAHQAFLSDLTTDQRALVGLHRGDAR